MSWSFARTIACNAQIDRQTFVYTSRFNMHTCLPFVGILWTFDRLQSRKKLIIILKYTKRYDSCNATFDEFADDLCKLPVTLLQIPRYSPLVILRILVVLSIHHFYPNIVRNISHRSFLAHRPSLL